MDNGAKKEMKIKINGKKYKANFIKTCCYSANLNQSYDRFIVVFIKTEDVLNFEVAMDIELQQFKNKLYKVCSVDYLSGVMVITEPNFLFDKPCRITK